MGKCLDLDILLLGYQFQGNNRAVRIYHEGTVQHFGIEPKYGKNRKTTGQQADNNDGQNDKTVGPKNAINVFIWCFHKNWMYGDYGVNNRKVKLVALL
jgi:hypothetical protein